MSATRARIERTNYFLGGDRKREELLAEPAAWWPCANCTGDCDCGTCGNTCGCKTIYCGGDCSGSIWSTVRQNFRHDSMNRIESNRTYGTNNTDTHFVATTYDGTKAGVTHMKNDVTSHRPFSG